MERKFLEDMGLEKDAIDKIMAAHGTDVEGWKTKISTAETNLTTANSTIKDLKDTVKKFDGVDVEKLKTDVSDWEKKYNKDIAETKFASALEVALSQSGAKSTKALRGLLDMEKIKLDGDKLIGLDEQLTTIKTDNGYLFGTEPNATGLPQGTPSNVDKFVSAAREAAGLPATTTT